MFPATFGRQILYFYFTYSSLYLFCRLLSCIRTKVYADIHAYIFKNPDINVKIFFMSKFNVTHLFLWDTEENYFIIKFTTLYVVFTTLYVVLHVCAFTFTCICVPSRESDQGV